jgi:hypothetical protein
MHAGFTGSCRKPVNPKSFPQPRTGWRICGGEQRMSACCDPWCLDPGTRWRTLLAVVQAKAWISNMLHP